MAFLAKISHTHHEIILTHSRFILRDVLNCYCNLFFFRINIEEVNLLFINTLMERVALQLQVILWMQIACHQIYGYLLASCPLTIHVILITKVIILEMLILIEFINLVSVIDHALVH